MLYIQSTLDINIILPEGVVIAVVGCLELDVHQVDGGGRRGDEEDLHTGIVQRDEVGEQVKVPSDTKNRFHTRFLKKSQQES